VAGHRDLRLAQRREQLRRTLESRQGLKVGSPEEAAWRQGLLTDGELEQRAAALARSGYGAYLLGLLRHPQRS
jgi:glucose-1-phosphate thymidylyltransferase